MSYHRKHILYRSYIIGIILLLFACTIAFTLINIQNSPDCKKYKQFAQKIAIRINPLKAHRGNIYDRGGNILSTSIVQYDVYVDFKTIKNTLFIESLKSLSDSIGCLFKKPAIQFYKKFSIEKKKENQYFPLAKGLDHITYFKLKQFPILSKGQIRGGFITRIKEKRIHSIENIGARTIGYDNNIGKVGLEGAYSKWLSGEDGNRLEQRISFNIWKPVNIWDQVEPKEGKDIYSTIDIEMQDIAYNALVKQLKASNADHGSVVLMEVKTGEIHAIVNLGKTTKNTYEDLRNFAVWEVIEPGSIFKPISLLAAFEDKKIDVSTLVDTMEGIYKLYGQKIRDNKASGYGIISTKKILEVSSNIGMAKIINDNYKTHPEDFIRHLKNWRLDKKLDIDIPGESYPYIPTPYQGNWSKITLPWMAFGYSLTMTPLQILNFYNAIANKGKMVKPMFITEIKEGEKVVKEYHPLVINSMIASEDSIKKIQCLLENVVKNGTAKKYYHPEYPYAGKTGTIQINYWMPKKKRHYNSSFVGYFPVNNPKYSCVVVISNPKNKYYASDIAIPVFDQIARKIYIKTYRKTLKIFKNSLSKRESIATQKKLSDSLSDYLPDLKGHSGREVIAILENNGIHVHYEGVGRVLKQSIPAGEKIKKGQSIYLILEK